MASIYRARDKWRAQVRRRGHATVSEVFDTKAEALRWARKVEQQMDSGGYVRATPTTLRALFKRYAEEVAPTHKGKRWEELRLDLFGRTMGFLERPLAEVTADVIRDWRDGRLKQVSPSTVNREMNLLSGVFNHAIKEWGVKLPANPVRNVKRPPRAKPRTRRVTDEEIEAIWQASGVSKTESPRWQKDYVPWMVEFAVETAMRLSEICRLEWKDVHLEESWVQVRATKNGTDREVALSPRAVEILGMMRPGLPTVFARNEGTVGVRYRELLKAAGLRDLHFHDSRREGATRLATRLNVLELAAQTGHQDVNTLRRVYYAPRGADLAKKLR